MIRYELRMVGLMIQERLSFQVTREVFTSQIILILHIAFSIFKMGNNQS